MLKNARRLVLLQGASVLRDYPIALGKNPKGPKRSHGDGRTPEGRYSLDWRIDDSKFHRAIHVSYPNERDLELAHKAGLAAGDGVMIHGLPEGEHWIGEAHTEFYWSNGCIAVTDDEMDEIWELLDDGTPIEIRP